MSSKPSKQQASNKTTTTTFNTPQQLFSYFQIPSPTTAESVSSLQATTISKKSFQEETQQQQQQQIASIKSNVVQQHQAMQATKVVQAPPPSGKPLLVQSPASTHPQHFYLMNQPTNGFFGYPPPMATNLQQNMYRLSSSPFLDSRYIYQQPQHHPAAVIKKDLVTSPPPSIQSDVKVVDPSNNLRQSCATIQGQMAANQIPLCLVQDSQGQLHQLVYTVPEDLYEKYVSAAKKGFKVRVQPHIESLKSALSKAAPTPSSYVNEEKALDNDEESKVCDEDLKLVKDIQPRSVGGGRSSGRKVNIAQITTPSTMDINCESQLTPFQENERQQPSSAYPQVDQSISNLKQIRDFSTTTATATATVLPRKSSHDPKTCSEEGRRKSDVLSLIKNSVEAIDTKSKERKTYINMSPDLVNCSPLSGIIPSTSSPPLVSSPVTTQTSNATPLPITQKLFGDEQLLSVASSTTVTHQQLSLDKGFLITATDKHDKTNTNENKQYLSALDDEKFPSSLQDYSTATTTTTSSLSPSDPKNELYHNINTIESILAKNRDALIPKCDVESLLRCLKRKLEQNDDDVTDHSSHNASVKRKKMTSLECRNTPVVTSYEKCNSFDYDSLDMLSPESLPRAESPCDSVFSSTIEAGSVSSLEMTSLETSNDSIIPSVSSSIDADLFDASTMEVDIIPNNSENDKTPNYVSNHIDFDLFDNLRDDLFPTDDALGYQDILQTASSNKPVHSIQEKSANRSQNTTMYSTDHFSFPTGQQNFEMDLFDHLWGELDNI